MAITEATLSRLPCFFSVLLPHLDERQRRLAVAAEARLPGHGGVRAAARAAGMSETTVRRGVGELESGAGPLPGGRTRVAGGGRKQAETVAPGLIDALMTLVEPDERGDPESPLRWTTKSLRHLAEELGRQGYPVSAPTVGRLLKGRSGRPRVNYRSTEEILRWSRSLLDSEPVADLTGDGHDTLTGYRSLLHGAHPVCEGHGTENEEADAVVRQVRGWTDAGVAPSDIAVCARFNTLTGKLADRLTAAGIPVVRVRDGEPDSAVGVRVSTLHSMKGLEYRCVAVVGATASAFPFPPAVTPAVVDGFQSATDLAAERCLLFVACTRAREALYVSYSGRPSEFLPE